MEPPCLEDELLCPSHAPMQILDDEFASPVEAANPQLLFPILESTVVAPASGPTAATPQPPPSAQEDCYAAQNARLQPWALRIAASLPASLEEQPRPANRRKSGMARAHSCAGGTAAFSMELTHGETCTNGCADAMCPAVGTSAGVVDILMTAVGMLAATSPTAAEAARAARLPATAEAAHCRKHHVSPHPGMTKVVTSTWTPVAAQLHLPAPLPSVPRACHQLIPLNGPANEQRVTHAQVKSVFTCCLLLCKYRGIQLSVQLRGACWNSSWLFQSASKVTRLCCSCWATTTSLHLVMRRQPVVFFEAAPVQHSLLGKWVCQLSSFAGGDWAAATTHKLSGSV